jgi:hypothetical protein
MRIRDIAQTRVSYGCRRIHILLRREGWKVNHKTGIPIIQTGRTAEETEEARISQASYVKGHGYLSQRKLEYGFHE